MRSKLLPSLASILVSAAAAIAQTGVHPQSLGFGLDWVHDKDTVFAMVRTGDYRRMLQVNPTTKEWKWINDSNLVKNGPSGPIAMKSRNDGVILNVSGAAPWYTTDGWKTLTMATGTAVSGINQVVSTEAGYAGHGNQNRGVMFSADGKEWTASEGGTTGSGGGLLRAYKNKVVIFGGGSFHFISTDGGKKYEIVTYNPTFKPAKSTIEFKMFSADSFLVFMDTRLYWSTDGGQKWDTGQVMPPNPMQVLVRGPLDYVVLSQNSTKLSYTKDGGVTWTQKDGPTDVAAYGRLAWIDGALYTWPGYKSTDDGATWTPFFPNFLNASGSGGAFCISSNGAFTAVGLTVGKIAYSWDKGRSFTVMDTIPGNKDVMALKILKNNRILAGDRNGQTFITTDTGRTWTQKLTSNFTQNAIKFSVSADEKVMVLTRSGQASGSGDNGEKWDFLPSLGGQLTQTVKPDGTIMGMANGQAYTLYLDKAGDKHDTIPFDQGPEDMIAVDNNIGYTVTRAAGVGITDNRVYRTEDGFKKQTLVATLEKLNWGALGTGGARFHLVNPDFIVLQSEARSFHLVSKDQGKTWTRDSLDIHAKAPDFPSIRRVHYFTPTERIFALTGQAIYLDIPMGPITVGVRKDLASRGAARAGFAASYDRRTGRLVLRNLGAALADISLLDVRGRRVLSRSVAGASQGVDVSYLPKGMYFVEARLPSGLVSNARFLKH